MGIWDSIKSAAWEANEVARVERLHKDLFLTQQQVQMLPTALQGESLSKFLALRETVIGQIANWSKDGGLRMAKEFFHEARKLQHFDRSNSLGFALAGLWLESGLRVGPKAVDVHASLESLAQSLVEAESAPIIDAHDPGRPVSVNRIKDSKSHKLSVSIRKKRVGQYSFEFQNDIHRERVVTILDLRYKCPHEWIRPGALNEIIGVSFSLDGGSERSLDLDLSRPDGVTECYGDQIELTIEVDGLIEVMIFQNKSGLSPDFVCLIGTT